MVDVHQIHLELILRLGVVAAIDLRISRQTRFDLQPQVERGRQCNFTWGILKNKKQDGIFLLYNRFANKIHKREGAVL